jgi:hypothetical protein
MIDHDRLFKELLKTFFAEFIDLFLPDLAADLERGSITFLDKEVFANLLTGAKHVADLVAQAKFRRQEAFFLIHLEHQDDPQALSPQRMFSYFAPLHLESGLPVYPIVLFSHRSKVAEPDEYGLSFPGLEVLRFRYRVIQLSRLHWRDFVRKPNPVASALMAKMGMKPAERPRVKLECLRLLVTLRLDPARMRLIGGFVDAYLRLSAQEELLFAKEADTLLGRNEKKKLMELTTSWEEKGLAKGLALGRSEGLALGRSEGLALGRSEGLALGRDEGFAEGSRSTVLHLLHRRYGRLAPGLEARLHKLSVERVRELAAAVFDLAGPKDLERWLAAHQT